jgi:hypothetical protein
LLVWASVNLPRWQPCPPGFEIAASEVVAATLQEVSVDRLAGIDCVLIDPGPTPSFGATLCQISSVTNGINGCKARNKASSTNNNVCLVDAADASSACNAGLASSRNQSQY